MPGNLLTNAGFLDGTAGWSGSAQLTLAVDETTRGAAGRSVLVGAGNTSATNQLQFLAPSPAGRAVVAPGQTVEITARVIALVNGASVTPSLQAIFYTAGGAQVGVPVPMAGLPPDRPDYIGRFGLRQTYHRGYLKTVVPATAVRCAVHASTTPAASGAAVVIALGRPQVAAAVPGRIEALCFDPGVHTVEDLQLPAWPSELQPFEIGPGADRLADHAEFQTGSTGPIQRRLSKDPARRFNGQMRCDAIQRAILEAHWSTGGKFYVVEPDTDRLCVANFSADSAPKTVEDRGVEQIVSVGLWLETA